MGIAERKTRQKVKMRTAILDAAWQIVESEGWQSLSIRKVADKIEYSVPFIYDHFSNKEAIQLEFTQEGFRLLNKSLIEAKSRFTSSSKQIEAIAFAYWDFAFSHTAHYQLMYGMGMPNCTIVNEVHEILEFSEIISEPIRKLIDECGNKEADYFLKMRAFWSTLHGLVSINMMGSHTEKDDINMMVLKDFISGFILGIKS